MQFLNIIAADGGRSCQRLFSSQGYSETTTQVVGLILDISNLEF